MHVNCCDMRKVKTTELSVNTKTLKISSILLLLKPFKLHIFKGLIVIIWYSAAKTNCPLRPVILWWIKSWPVTEDFPFLRRVPTRFLVKQFWFIISCFPFQMNENRIIGFSMGTQLQCQCHRTYPVQGWERSSYWDSHTLMKTS